MAEKKINIEFEDEKEESVSFSSAFKGVMDGTLITKKAVTTQLPFLLFIALIGILYISNRYHAEKMVRELKETKTELGELRAHALYTSSELMRMGRQTEVAEIVKKFGLDLKESEQPPKKIIVNSIPGD